MYWLREPLGPAPASSLYIFDDEVLRLDCLGGEAGYLHMNMKQSRLLPQGVSARLYFSPGSVNDHIDRAVFELMHNLHYLQILNRNRRIRRLKVDRAELTRAAEWMRERMQALIEQRSGNSSTMAHASQRQDLFTATN
ncbi:MAG: hypothetical protein U5P41_09350 [Gammaproteobacteria bacterium]|nr:hypothetical protein [Gammaproteobacteria bacterium]